MPNEAQGAEAEEPKGAEEQEPDYKALYEQEKAHSRSWEKKAKANREAADQLESLQKDGKTPQERISELESRLDAKEKAEARARLVAKVAQEKGVPADLLTGDTEAQLEAYADKLLAYGKRKPAARVENPGSFAKGGKDESGVRRLTRELFGND